MAEKNIEVKIGNRKYPLSIDSSESELVKSAVKRINDNINKLKGNYVVTDYVDLLAMTALELAMGGKNEELTSVSSDLDKPEVDLSEIEEILDKALASS